MGSRSSTFGHYAGLALLSNNAIRET